MYEVITDSYPYPEIENGKLSSILFPSKVVSENYRPKFNYPIKEPLKKLIEKCWSANPNERPNFGEIFNKLTNKNDDDEDNCCILEDVDMDDFQIYVEDITEITDSTEKLLDKMSKIKKENMKLKKENDNLNEKIKSVETENTELRKSNDMLKKVNKQNLEEIEALKRDKEEQQRKIEAIESENKKLKKAIKESKNSESPKKTSSYVSPKIDKKDDEAVEKLRRDIEHAREMVKKHKETEKTSSRKDDRLTQSSKDIIIDDIKISKFNSLPLKSQQSISEKISKSDCESSKFFNAINNLILYLLKIEHMPKLCFQICADSKLNLVHLNDKQRVHLDYDATEALYQSKSFNSSEFLSILNDIHLISIEMKYPSESFK